MYTAMNVDNAVDWNEPSTGAAIVMFAGLVVSTVKLNTPEDPTVFPDVSATNTVAFTLPVVNVKS